MKLFPRGVAKGEAFYDRIEERKKLKSNIVNGIHTVLIAPRRFGKTSLMTQVMYETEVKHVWLDFMMVTDRHEAQAKLFEKIEQLIVEVSPIERKLKELCAKYFKVLKPEITISAPGISLKLFPKEILKESIVEALLGLDKFAQELDQNLVIVFDEFQEILRFDDDATLQGSIRHAAERSQKVTYLFSGSRHRPLRKMFNGKKSPLYALCEQITLNKIPAKDYIDFINKVAKGKWGRVLSPRIIDKILNYSERYPKYVNAICSNVWSSGLEPTPELIDTIWQEYVISIKTDIADVLAELSINQRRLLMFLVFNPTKELYSKETQLQLKIPHASIQKAISVLLDKDLVFLDQEKYQVLDPTLKSYFMMF